MSVFDWLIVAHLTGDWLLQTEYEARYKAQGSFFNKALFKHCLIYTLTFVPFTGITGMHWYWLMYILATHLFFDRRWPIVGILRTIKRTSPETMGELPWLVIVVDQVVHVLTLIPIALLTY